MSNYFIHSCIGGVENVGGGGGDVVESGAHVGGGGDDVGAGGGEGDGAFGIVGRGKELFIYSCNKPSLVPYYPLLLGRQDHCPLLSPFYIFFSFLLLP